MRIWFVSLALCVGCLHAQPYSSAPLVPQDLQIHAEGAFGYDSNVRLSADDEQASYFLQQRLRAGYGLELPLSRLFVLGEVYGRWPTQHPGTSTWFAGARVGWAAGQAGDTIFGGLDLGANVEKRHVYEIFGPITRQEGTRRAWYDARAWFDLSLMPFRLQTRAWIAANNLSERTKGRSWDLRALPAFEPAQGIGAGSMDHTRAGGSLWVAAEPVAGLAFGPYVWFEHTQFHYDATLTLSGEVTDNYLDFQRLELGTRMSADIGPVTLENRLHFRRQLSMDPEDQGALDYDQWGWAAGVGLEFAPVRGKLSWEFWRRDYRHLTALTEPFAAGTIFAGSIPQLEEDGRQLAVEMLGSPVEHVSTGFRYQWNQRRSNARTLAYHQHEISILLQLDW